MTQVRLRILGECIIEIGDSTLEPSATHVFALALYLSIERGKVVSRSLLADLFFPNTAVNSATHNLRQLLYRLRHKGAPLECTATGVMLPERCVIGTPENALNQTYAEALDAPAHRGLLPGYQPPTGPLSTWLEFYRDTLTHKLQSRLSNHLHRARQGADWAAVERFARSLSAFDGLTGTSKDSVVVVVQREEPALFA